MESAVGFFRTMPEHDSTSLCALISGLVRNGELDLAAGILRECGNGDDGKDDLVHAYNTLIAGYGQRGHVIIIGTSIYLIKEKIDHSTSWLLW